MTQSAGDEPRPRQWPLLGLLLLLTIATGAAGSAVTLPEIPAWYAGLTKPAWTPPNALFGPAWTTLYILMAIAAWLALSAASRAQRLGVLWPWVIQLLLNAAWSPLFFAWHAPGFALADIAALWLAIAVTIAAFFRVSRPAALLLLPYLAWVSYATALNLAIVRLNP